MTDRSWTARGIDTSRAHPARVYNYLLGGKDNFAADRSVAQELLTLEPGAIHLAREARAFLRRAVRHLVREVGIRQFVDIGSGMPTHGSVHEVAEEFAPDARVVYVDNDPVVQVHAEALLPASERIRFTLGDLRQPEQVLNDPVLRDTIDPDQPVGLLLIAVLQLVQDYDHPWDLVARYRDALPAGSHLVIAHAGTDADPEKTDRLLDVYRRRSTQEGALRPLPEVERFFDGFELLDPGVVQVSLWRPTKRVVDRPEHVRFYGGVGRKGPNVRASRVPAAREEAPGTDS